MYEKEHMRSLKLHNIVVLEMCMTPLSKPNSLSMNQTLNVMEMELRIIK